MKLLSKNDLPEVLLEIPQVPDHLYIEGELPSFSENVFLAVVGSRKYSAYGKDVCEKLIEGLAGYPIVIVSGLAIGIDTIAHETAIRVGLKTLAIPGSGLDRKVIYPSLNRRLADRILETGGCLLSESEPLERATIWSFPRRNRLMAGLSKAVLIIEASEKSGTLITARLALDYNREVLVVPGSIFSPSSIGSNRLIRQGATPVCSSSEILDALGFEMDDEKKPQNLYEDLSSQEQILVNLLRTEPLTRDEVILKSGISASEANSLLMVLEIKGITKETGGDIVLRY